MIDAMLLRGFAPQTQDSYCAAVVALAKHYHRPPDTLSAGRLQSHLLFLITEKKLAYTSVNQAACAFRFMFGTVLRWPGVRFDIPMAKVPKRLPQILSREDVTRLIDASTTLRGRALLSATYAAGLRISEVCGLQLADIESAPDRTVAKASSRRERRLHPCRCPCCVCAYHRARPDALPIRPSCCWRWPAPGVRSPL